MEGVSFYASPPFPVEVGTAMGQVWWPPENRWEMCMRFGASRRHFGDIYSPQLSLTRPFVFSTSTVIWMILHNHKLAVWKVMEASQNFWGLLDSPYFDWFRCWTWTVPCWTSVIVHIRHESFFGLLAWDTFSLLVSWLFGFKYSLSCDYLVYVSGVRLS